MKACDANTRRVILLGASNLTRAFPLAVTSLPAGLPGPLDVLAALGHGRSFGLWSRVLGRTLPGIAECGLWRRLDECGTDGPPPLAAIMDVGNDLVYGAGVAQVLGWLDICLERLARRRSSIVLMSLPLGSLARLTPQRFELLRRVLFPAHPMSWPILQERICQLDERMRALGAHYGVRWIESSPAWYGFDRIHIRRRDQARVWRELFSNWPDWNPAAPVAYPAWTESLGLRCLRPAECYLLGYHRMTPQPVLSRPGLRISVY
jgi:hypothetical protein